MHLPGVAELVFDGDCGRQLDKFSKTGSGVGKTPGGQLDIKIVERTMYELLPVFPSCECLSSRPLNFFYCVGREAYFPPLRVRE